MKHDKTQRPKRRTHYKIGTQLILVYIFAVFIPIVVLSSYVLNNMAHMQNSYYSDLLSSYNDGVSQTIYEITSQIYTISDSIVYNDELIDFLNGEYDSETELREAIADTVLLDKYVSKYAGVEDICVYVDRDDMVNQGDFYKVDDEIRSSEWYQKALNQYMPFWFAYESKSSRGGNYKWNLTLVRKMVLVGGDREAVIMIKVTDSYLSSRLGNSQYVTRIAVDGQQIAFTNVSADYGSFLGIDVVQGDETYSYTGAADYDGVQVMADVETLKLSKTANYIYLVSYDTDAYNNVRRIIINYGLASLAALAITLVVMWAFAGRFTGQVRRLRDEMGKASRGEYREMSADFAGSEELTEAFDDLVVMVDGIQRLEAEQYESQLRQQEIRNEQQKMEFKMLSSQINPHFLYNTLETIRMKALTAGDREVANAIKLLGKSMRYVLDNSGMADTTLQKEYEHVMNYLQIQKLRFGDRVNYEAEMMPELHPDTLRIIPLILQPIVENAIVHGLEARENDGHVWLAMYIMDERLYIDVSDNGQGMTEEELSAINARLGAYMSELPTVNIGLYNINRRIKLNYGETYGLSLKSIYGEGTRVTVQLPVIRI